MAGFDHPWLPMRYKLSASGFGATVLASRAALTACARRAWLRLRAWRQARHHLLEKFSHRTFDWWHRVDTRVLDELAALDIGSGNKPHGERYQASPIYSLRKLLRRLDIDHADFSFIDIGSGKGRAAAGRRVAVPPRDWRGIQPGAARLRAAQHRRLSPPAGVGGDLGAGRRQRLRCAAR